MERRQRQAVEEMVSVLTRLGVHTLAQFTSLPVGDVLTRFGQVGMWAYRLARGEDVRPPVVRRSDEDITVEYAFEEPAQRVEQLALVAHHVAQQLDQALVAAGVRCGKVRISARTERGEQVERVWRTDVGVRPGAFARHMSDRVRWQLEGWLSGTSQGPEPAPLVALEVTAEDVVPLGAEQDYLWGGTSGADSRAQRTLERVQTIVGPEGVLAVREQGGRSARDRVLTLPWGQEATPARPAAPPWPGRLPDPPPATVLAVPEPIALLDAGGAPVVVDRRLGLSSPPTWVRHLESSPQHRGGPVVAPLGRPVPIDSWAGPWPMVERWWSEDAARRVHLQIALADGPALLVAYGDGQWVWEALYD
jgi:protein ImuB